MRITRVIGTADAICKEPGYIIEKDCKPDAIIIQDCSKKLSFGENTVEVLVQKEWQLTPKDIYRYSIEGKAKVITKRTVDGERTFVENAKDICIGSGYEGKIVFSITDEERIVGLGQHEDGIANYRNCRIPLYQNNMQIPMPVFVSDRNYAVVFDAPCLMVYEEHHNEITVTLDAISQIDYYVIEGENQAEIVKGIRYLTGKAPLLPLWAYGYVQSKERYRSQEDVLLTAEEFETRNIPVSCLVQDWMTWETGKWGNKMLDKSRYPNLIKLTQKLHEKGIAFMVSVWPNMNKGCEDNLEMMEAGKLYANLSTYDAFDEEARKLYWKQCDKELFAGGTDAWWCDSTEPFTPDWGGSEEKMAEDRYELAKESLTKYMDARDANGFALWHARGMYENQLAEDAARRVVNLTRSGYSSIQKYGAVLWSGDISASWDVLRKQIVEGLHMVSSGMPYWTLDIGGFFTGKLEAWKRWSGAKEGTQPWFWNGDYEDGVADMGYRELYVRWLQYGTFLPIMRSHGTDTPREPWHFGEPGTVYYDTIVKYIRLRYKLVPYIYSLAYDVYQNDTLMMKSLLCAYGEDKKAAAISDAFLFGDFLVCPVTAPVQYGPYHQKITGEPVKEVYLPAGDNWFEYESRQWYQGGTQIQAKAPIDTMPLYIRSGSILPVNPTAQANLYDVQKTKQLTVEIYGGKDASFVYYLDSGNGYEYQQGEYAAISLTWEDEQKRFTMADACGSYPAPERWTIHYCNTEGIVSTRQVEYYGKALQVEWGR